MWLRVSNISQAPVSGLGVVKEPGEEVIATATVSTDQVAHSWDINSPVRLVVLPQSLEG